MSPVSTPEVTFLRTAGAVLALWGSADLAADTGLPVPPPGPSARVALALNVESPGAVDEVLAAMTAAGATVLRAAAATAWGGYTACAADPDGHVWELAHNPGFPLGEDGLPRLP